MASPKPLEAPRISAQPVKAGIGTDGDVVMSLGPEGTTRSPAVQRVLRGYGVSGVRSNERGDPPHGNSGRAERLFLGPLGGVEARQVLGLEIGAKPSESPRPRREDLLDQHHQEGPRKKHERVQSTRGHRLQRYQHCNPHVIRLASSPLPGRPCFALLSVVAFAASCRHSTGSAPPGSCPGGQDEAVLGAIVVHKADARPAWVLVPREGDPRAAVAAVVITGGASYASTTLSALVEARLQKSGFPSVEARADRDSFRLRSLVETPERAVEFTRALQKALSTPVSAGGPELGLVSRRVVSLKRRPFEAPIVASVARCTGELGILASEPAPDPVSPEGLAALERARTLSYASLRVAFAVVGPSPLTDGTAEGWASGDKWPEGASVEPDGSSDDEVGVFAAPARPAGPPRVTLALTQRRADAAVDAAAQAGSTEGALVARLRALSVPFRVVEAVGTARPQGGCVGLTLEALRPPPSGLEEAAALAATIARQEVEARARAVPEEAGRDRGLGYLGTRAVRSSSDPREAAELAALWSLTAPASSSDERGHAVVALSAKGPAQATTPWPHSSRPARRDSLRHSIAPTRRGHSRCSNDATGWSADKVSSGCSRRAPAACSPKAKWMRA